jgi:Ca2+-binding RTX toxin-like protein
MSQILTDNSDFVFATQGTVYGLDGNDVIFTSQPSPTLYGGVGNDLLGNQGTGPTDAFGGQGNDTIHGGTITDRLYGDGGTDLIVGGEFDYAQAALGSIVPSAAEVSGDDTIYGGDSTDSLWGFDGNDTIYGGEDDDTNTINIVVQGNCNRGKSPGEGCFLFFPNGLAF